jgi:cell shape-determining protein MreC
MKNKEVPLFVVFILIGVILLSVGIGIVKYISLVETRYEGLLNNTMRLVDNITRIFTSLESDKLVQQLSSKVGTLKKDNVALKYQLKESERQLSHISKIEKNCQMRLNSTLRQNKIDSELNKQASRKKQEIKSCLKSKSPFAGNRGFLIKDGKAN